MDRVQEKIVNIACWPTPQEYNEAVQNLQYSMLDHELRCGTPELNEFGLPKPNSGTFASVYKITAGINDWALRCFLFHRPEQHERYKILQSYLEGMEPEWCVPFSYLEKGINVQGQELPLLKMRWVDGVDLCEYIDANLCSRQNLSSLRDEFKKQVQRLMSLGIAHGDLQHGNILVANDKVRLVDYDGMYIPSLQGLGSAEIGHRNYQHPHRTSAHFGPWLDNFPSWVIYCSLTCLMQDPRLWHVLEAGDESLLFRQADFDDPLRSRAFYVLEQHPDPKVHNSAKYLRSLLNMELPDIPYLGSFPESISILPEVQLPAAPPTKNISSTLHSPPRTFEQSLIQGLICAFWMYVAVLGSQLILGFLAMCLYLCPAWPSKPFGIGFLDLLRIL